MEQWWHYVCPAIQIGENMKYIVGLMLLLFASVSWANCTGCGEDGHQVCPIKDAAHEPEVVFAVCVFADGSLIEPEVVFAVCVFADGTLVDHKGANSMSDCLKTKRAVEKEWRNRAETTDTVELNGITYQIDGESLVFMCDLVDAQVHHYADGSWEIIEILGKHKEE